MFTAEETLCENLTRRWTEDKRIVIYTPTRITGIIVAVWREAIVETLKTWPQEERYLALHDLRAVRATVMKLVDFNPYTVRLWEVQRDDPPSALAVVINGRDSVTNLLQLSQRPDDPDAQFQTFFEIDDGLQWLKSYLPPPAA